MVRISTLGDTQYGDLVVIDNMVNDLYSSFGNIDLIRIDSSSPKGPDGRIVLTGFAKYDLPFENFLSKQLPVWKEYFDARLEVYINEITKFA